MISFGDIIDRVSDTLNNAVDTVKQTAKQVYNSVINDSEPAKKPSGNTKSENKPNSVMNIKEKVTRKVGDEFVKNSKEQNTHLSNNKAKQNNIKPKEVTDKKNVQKQTLEAEIKYIGKNFGISDNLLNKLIKENNAEDVKKAVASLKNIDISSDVNIEALVEEKVKFYAKVRNKNIKNIEQYSNIQKIRSQLGEDFKQLPFNKKFKRIETLSNYYKQEFEKIYKQRYEKASPAEKAKMEQNKETEYELFQEQLQINFLAIIEDCAEESVILRNGHHLADATKKAYSLKKNSMEVANRMTADWYMKKLEYFNARGDMPTAKEYGESVKGSTAQMSNECVIQFEQRAHELKQDFYNGTSEYKFLTEDYYTETTIAVGIGATLNANMTTEEKAAFLRTWDQHAQKFSDYDEVKGRYYIELKEYVEKHPDSKQGIEDIKTKYKEKYGHSPDLPRAQEKRYNTIQNTTPVIIEEDSKNKESVTDKSVSSVVVATPIQIEQVLMTKSYEEARETYSKNSDKDFAEVILHNPKLKSYKQHIVGYIKTLSAEDLSDITRGCSTDMFLFVLRNINPDKAGRLYDLQKGEKCYAARKLGEKIIEEGKKDAAA